MAKKHQKKDIKANPVGDFIEIRDGKLNLQIPKDRDYEDIIRILLVFNNPTTPKQVEVEPEPQPEPEQIEVSTEPQFDEYIQRCPKCNSKLKQKVIKRGDEFIRIVRCKKNKRFRKKCDFAHEFSIKV